MFGHFRPLASTLKHSPLIGGDCDGTRGCGETAPSPASESTFLGRVVLGGKTVLVWECVGEAGAIELGDPVVSKLILYSEATPLSQTYTI